MRQDSNRRNTFTGALIQQGGQKQLGTLITPALKLRVVLK